METVSRLFEQSYVPNRLIGKSPRTRVLYRSTIKKFSRWLGHEARLSDLETDTVAAYLCQLADDGAAMASVAKERSQLLAIANFAAKRGMIRFVDVPTVRIPERVPEAWSVEQMSQLLETCKNRAGFVGHVQACLWWTSIHLCLWDTAERIGALFQATWSNFGNGTLLVPAEHRKGKTRDRLYELRDSTVAAIERIRRPQRELIWPWPHNTALLYLHYDKILARAGLPVGKRNKFHKIRRSVATHMKAAGVDPQHQLDHANARTTAKYVDPRICRPATAKDILPEL